MAGVMSRNLSMADKLKKNMDECIRMGIDVKGPDVNESIEKFGVTKNGEIRFGLGAVKGVGSNAVRAIIEEREKNGAYKDIYDFVERVNLANCNRAAIESLAMAGTFDSLNVPREAFVEPMFDSTWADMLVKYGQTVQNDKNSMQASLFGDLEPLELAKPPMPAFTPWPRMKLLDKEKSMVTIYLSAHPLDPYYMELTYGCNCACADFEEKAVAGATLTLGGMVTGFQTRTSKSGKPWGIATIEDFSGSVDLKLFGNNFETYKNRFQTGDMVMVRMNVQPGRFNPAMTDINYEEITDLEKVKGKVANMVTIFIDHKYDDSDFLTTLPEYCDGGSRAAEEEKENRRPGDLYLKIYDPQTRQVIQIHSRKKVTLNRKFMKFVEDHDLRYKVETFRM